MAGLPVVAQIETNTPTVVVGRENIVFYTDIRDKEQPIDSIRTNRQPLCSGKGVDLMSCVHDLSSYHSYR